MSTRGWKHAHLAGTARVATIGLLVVACGNDQQPAATTCRGRSPRGSSGVRADHGYGRVPQDSQAIKESLVGPPWGWLRAFAPQGCPGS
ncbi:MAG TPA: hypothetical protein VGD71_36305 [Kribbella sp.]